MREGVEAFSTVAGLESAERSRTPPLDETGSRVDLLPVLSGLGRVAGTGSGRFEGGLSGATSESRAAVISRILASTSGTARGGFPAGNSRAAEGGFATGLAVPRVRGRLAGGASAGASVLSAVAGPDTTTGGILRGSGGRETLSAGEAENVGGDSANAAGRTSRQLSGRSLARRSRSYSSRARTTVESGSNGISTSSLPAKMTANPPPRTTVPVAAKSAHRGSRLLPIPSAKWIAR